MGQAEEGSGEVGEGPSVGRLRRFAGTVLAHVGCACITLSYYIGGGEVGSPEWWEDWTRGMETRFPKASLPEGIDMVPPGQEVGEDGQHGKRAKKTLGIPEFHDTDPEDFLADD